MKQRKIKLLPRDTKPYMTNWLSVSIESRGWDPSKAKIIEVHIPIMGKPRLDLTPMRYLKLVRQQRGKIMNAYPKPYSYPDRPNLGGERLATMEELKAYQGYINQGSPIEHK